MLAAFFLPTRSHPPWSKGANKVRTHRPIPSFTRPADSPQSKKPVCLTHSRVLSTVHPFCTLGAEYDDDEENEENEYYEEEEEEEEVTSRSKKGPKRKKRRKSTTLIDMEAEEDDVEDEDEEDDVGDSGIVDDDDDVDAEADRERDLVRAQRLEREIAMKDDDPQALARYISERYERDADDFEADAPDTSGIDQQSLLPSIRDPRLWIVRCTKPGHERKAIFSLLQKSFNYKSKDMDLGIFSAVAPEHLKGRIYIEAFSAAQVELAVNGLDLFSTYGGVKALRLEEMPEVLKIGKRNDKQLNGNWVRIRRKDSIYRGDLAQVCNVRDGTGDKHVTIRLIPRIDYKGEKDYLSDENRDDGEVDQETGTRRKGRPPQRLFDKKEITSLTGKMRNVIPQREILTGVRYDTWNGDLYRFGLLYMMKVNVRGLITGDAVQPTLEELEQWIFAEKNMKYMFEEDPSSMEADVAARGLELDISSVAGRRTTKLFKGDAVRATQGEQRGIEGTIASIDGDMVLVQIKDVPDPLRVNRSDLEKVFKVGEHVKVSSGKYAGYAGAIVSVEKEFLTIFADSTREEIKVLSSQVADSSDVNTDVLSKKGGSGLSVVQYELFDLVQMLADTNEKGVVIQVQDNLVTILTTQNTRRVVPISTIKGKVRDDSVRALDARGNPIAPNDSIHVMSGPLQNRQGVVKHVAGTTVFFKAPDEVNNCGLFAVVSKMCTASTAAARRLTSTMRGSHSHNMPASIPRGAGSSLGRFGRGGGGGAQGGTRDQMFRKDVKIKSGPYKGYTGRVVDATDDKVRVELTSKMKVITIARSRVKLEKEEGGGSNATGGLTSGLNRIAPMDNRPSRSQDVPSTSRLNMMGAQNNDMYRNRTPHVDRHAGGMYTPHHHPGSATPRAPMATPAHYGNSTPGHDAFSAPVARSQRYGDDFGSSNAFRVPQTPVAEGNPYEQPSYMPQTPATPAAAQVPSTPTPALGGYAAMEPRTPGIMEPGTPGGYSGVEPLTPAPGMEPTTPAPGIEPRTPAPGQEPHTPGPGLEPSTPMVQEPSTPHTPGGMPQTPHPHEEEVAPEVDYRVLLRVEVLVNNTAATVTHAAPDGSQIRVRMLDGDQKGEEVEVAITDIMPVQPRHVGEEEVLVKVLDGPSAGQIGYLTSVIEEMGTIKFQDGEVATLQMSHVAKCTESSA